MSIKTKSIYAPAETSDGRRILVTRYHPRGVKRTRYDEWDRSLAPSARLLKKYRGLLDVDWAEFERALLLELGANPDSMRVVRRLHAYSRTHTKFCCKFDVWVSVTTDISLILGKTLVGLAPITVGITLGYEVRYLCGTAVYCTTISSP